MDHEKLTEVVNQSGFPLQIAVKNLVDRTTGLGHHWRVIYTEHAWENSLDSTSGFLDLALEDGTQRSVLVVECKRVLDTDWIFLQPGDRIIQRSYAKAWVTKVADRPNNAHQWFGWFGLPLDPTSAECEFCIVRGQDAKAKPMLERVAAELMSATEALAIEENSIQGAGCELSSKFEHPRSPTSEQL